MSYSSYSKSMFTLQQKTVRMIGAKPRNSSRDLLKGTQILHLPCEYIVSFTDITVNNQEKFHTNSVVHSVNTRIKPHIPFMYSEKQIPCSNQNTQQFTKQTHKSDCCRGKI